MDKFNKGQFSLRDMYEQFENVMKLGPLNKVMAMIPGIPQMMGGGFSNAPSLFSPPLIFFLGALRRVRASSFSARISGGDQEGGNRLKRFMFMMDSMTDDELDGRVDLSVQDTVYD